jgi:AraC-like DNA-binding protein
MLDSSAQRDEPAYFSSQVSAARRFYLGRNASKRKRLVVNSGGFERCDPAYAIDRPSFPDLCVEFVLTGRGWLSLAGRESEMEAGVVFTYGPGVPQRMTADPKDPPQKYFIDFNGTDARRLMRKCKLAPGTCRRTASPHEIARVLEEIVRDGVRGGPYAAELCSAMLEYLLLKIVATPDIEKAQSAAYATYMKCREWIEANYLRVHTLRDIARATQVDEAYLCRLFRRYDHQSPHELVTRLRMNRAVELLNDPRLLIKQVATEVGYADPFHFSRTFKRMYGVSPKGFRSYRS